MHYSRREFISGASLLLGAALAGLPRVLLADSAPDSQCLIVGGWRPHSVCAINIKSRMAQIVSIDFPPHGFAFNPQQPARSWVIEKWGAHASEVDFGLGEITHKLKSPEGTQFFGHALFSPQGEILYIVQENLKTGLGHLIGYETGDFKPVLDYQVTPGGLHECHLLPDNTCMVVSNGMPIGKGYEHARPVEKSSLVHVDLSLGKILDKKFIEDDDHVLGHFAVASDGALVAISGPRRSAKFDRGAIYFGRLGQPGLKRIVLPPDVDAQLKGEMLSVALDDEQHMAVVTNPLGRVLIFIDTREGTFSGSMHEWARGVVFDPALEKFLFSGSTLFVTRDGQEPTQPFSIKDRVAHDITGPFNSAHSLLAEMTL